MNKSWTKHVVCFLLVSTFMIGTRSFSSYGAQPSPATVEDLSGDKYFPAVKDALKNARSSIYMVMYQVNFDPSDKRSYVAELVEELVNAHKRGVKVKVVLDQNIDFASWKRRGGQWQREEKNDPLFVYLKQQGIEVYYDNLFVVTHIKAIVIDEETVVVGSANWSQSAFKTNREASCLVQSKKLAKEFLDDFSRITLDYEASVLDEERKPPVKVSTAFFSDKDFAPRMIASSDETAFDLYLLLLRKFDGNSQGRVDIDYKEISAVLGLDKKFSYVSARDTLREALTRLDQRYKLIERQKRPPKSPYCILAGYHATSPYAIPQEKYCLLPDEYWQYGWNQRLSFPEKYCMLINLSKAGTRRGHLWSGYRAGLMDEFNLGRDTVIRGMKGLRELNLVEIEYPEYPEKGGYEERDRTIFTWLGFYSLQTLEKEKTRLAKLYGKELFTQAHHFAGIVYKENDIQVIEDIIRKIEEYGSEHVALSFGKIAEKAPDNPKRSYKYVVGILQTEANALQDQQD